MIQAKRLAVPKTLSPREEELVRQLATLQEEKVGERNVWKDLINRLTS